MEAPCREGAEELDELAELPTRNGLLDTEEAIGRGLQRTRERHQGGDRGQATRALDAADELGGDAGLLGQIRLRPTDRLATLSELGCHHAREVDQGGESFFTMRALTKGLLAFFGVSWIHNDRKAPMMVLVLDDDERVSRAVVRRLRSLQINAASFTRVDALIEQGMGFGELFETAILDFHLGDVVDGADALAALRASGFRGRCAFYSGSPAYEINARLAALEMSERPPIFTKGVDFDRLVDWARDVEG